MTHDPICPQRECDACAWEGSGCCRGDCRCEEYAKVRADERKQAEARVETLRNHPGLITISAAAALAAGDTWTSQL